jgi:SAM-dependent methyltransferase
MDEYVSRNLKHWNEVTPIHEKSKLYDVEGFKRGGSRLSPLEREEVGDVAGKNLLHLQCHFGLDTMSWARLGAKVTGVDFSDKAIDLARSLSQELGIDVDFICSDIFDLPEVLKKKFDIVFSSNGVLCWLPDLSAWANIIARFLKPEGFFYIVESHPVADVFENERDTKELKARHSYFYSPQPAKWIPEGTYADKEAKVTNPTYEWTHPLSDIVNSLISAGLRIDFLHEFPYLNWDFFPFMEKDKDGWWRFKERKETIPLMFSLKATKSA